MTDTKNTEDQELSLDELKNAAGGIKAEAAGATYLKDNIGGNSGPGGSTFPKDNISGNAGPGGSTYPKDNIAGSASPGGDDI